MDKKTDQVLPFFSDGEIRGDMFLENGNNNIGKFTFDYRSFFGGASCDYTTKYGCLSWSILLLDICWCRAWCTGTQLINILAIGKLAEETETSCDVDGDDEVVVFVVRAIWKSNTASRLCILTGVQLKKDACIMFWLQKRLSLLTEIGDNRRNKIHEIAM